MRDRFRRLTYRQLLAATDAFAADLASYGARAGERIGVWLPSRIESVIALLACSKSGAVCCPSLHRDHTTGEVVELMQRTRAVAFVWQSGYGADADKSTWSMRSRPCRRSGMSIAWTHSPKVLRHGRTCCAGMTTSRLR